MVPYHLTPTTVYLYCYLFYLYNYLGVYLKDTILKVLNKFKIEPFQVYTVTTDNGANMIKATKLIGEHILSEVISDNESETETEQMEVSESEAGSSIESDYDRYYFKKYV